MPSPCPLPRRPPEALRLCTALFVSVLAALSLTSCEDKSRSRFELSDTQISSASAPKGTDPGAESSPETDVFSLLSRPADNTPRRLIIVSCLDEREPMADTRMRLLDRFSNAREGIRMIYWGAQGDPVLQATQIRNQLAEKPFAIILIGGGPAALIGTLTDAMLQNVKVISIGCELDSDHCSTSILVDEKKIGRLAGEFVIDALKRKSQSEGLPETVGRVVQITGDPLAKITRERSQGFTEALAKSPGVQLVHDAPAYWDAKETKLRLADALRIQKHFDVVFAHSDVMASAANEALKALQPSPRENMLILGVDGAVAKGGGVQMIIKGDLDASIYNPPLVDLAWKVLVRLLDEPGYKPKPRYDIEPFAINPAKANEMSLRGVPPPPL